MLNGYIPENRFLPYLSWTQIANLPDKKNTVIVLPVGAIEQHGPHLPVAVDSETAFAMVGKALEQLDANIPAYGIPPLSYGKSDEHLHFPGTITLTGPLFMETIIEIGESLYRSGFRKLLVINGHGGQVAPLDMAGRELRLRHGDFIFIHKGTFNVPHNTEFVDEWENTTGMHAGHKETALMQALIPQHVDMSKAVNNTVPRLDIPTLSSDKPPMAWCSRDYGPTGVIGNATVATAEEGKQLVDDLASSWAKAIAEMHHLQWPERTENTWGKGHFEGDIMTHDSLG